MSAKTGSTVSCRAEGYQGVPVGTIKRHITGKGNADKAAVLSAVRERGFNPFSAAVLAFIVDCENASRPSS